MGMSDAVSATARLPGSPVEVMLASQKQFWTSITSRAVDVSSFFARDGQSSSAIIDEKTAKLETFMAYPSIVVLDYKDIL